MNDSTIHRSHSLLAAMVLGLVSSPVAFAVIGGRRDLQPMFLVIALPPLLAAVGFLLFRYLARPTAGPHRWLGRTFEVVSWLVAMAFLTIVSGVNLLVGFERVGMASGIFLAASLLWLPVVFKRRTALEHRVAALSPKRAGAIVAIVTTVAAVAALVNLSASPRFPGG